MVVITTVLGLALGKRYRGGHGSGVSVRVKRDVKLDSVTLFWVGLVLISIAHGI